MLRNRFVEGRLPDQLAVSILFGSLLRPMLLKRFGYVIGLLKLKPMACIELQNARSFEICSQKVGMPDIGTRPGANLLKMRFRRRFVRPGNVAPAVECTTQGCYEARAAMLIKTADTAGSLAGSLDQPHNAVVTSRALAGNEGFSRALM